VHCAPLATQRENATGAFARASTKSRTSIYPAAEKTLTGEERAILTAAAQSE
jgi:hypothetical protein